MYRLFNFLNRNLAKILWGFAILVWVGVGVYYFTTRTPLLFKFIVVTSEPPVPIAKKESISDTNWYKFGMSLSPYTLSFKHPPELFPESPEMKEIKSEDINLLTVVNFIPKETTSVSTLQLKIYFKTLDNLLSQEQIEEAKSLIVGGLSAKKILSVDTEDRTIETIYISLDNRVLVLQSSCFEPETMEMNCREIMKKIIDSFQIKKE